VKKEKQAGNGNAIFIISPVGYKKKYANETNLDTRYIQWIYNAGVNQTKSRL